MAEIVRLLPHHSATHTTITCPGCSQTRRARYVYLGRRITCKHCRLTFRAKIDAACPSCRSPLKIRPQWYGRKLSCKGCEHSFRLWLQVPCPYCKRPEKFLPRHVGGEMLKCSHCAGRFQLGPVDEALQSLKPYQIAVMFADLPPRIVPLGSDVPVPPPPSPGPSLEDIKRRLRVAQEEARGYQDEMKLQGRRMQELERQLLAARESRPDDGRVAALQAEFQRERVALEAEIASLRQRVDDFRQAADNANSAVDRLTAANDERLRQQIEEVRRDFDRERLALTAEIESLRTARDAARVNHEEELQNCLSEAWKEFDAERVRLQAEVERLRGEAEALRVEVAPSPGTPPDDLESRLAEVRQGFERDRAALLEEVARLREEMAQLRADRDDARRDLAARNGREEDLERRLKLREGELSRTAEELAAARREREAARGEAGMAQRLVADLDAARRGVEEAETKGAQAARALASLKAERDALVQRANGAEERLKSNEARRREEAAQLTARLAAAEAERTAAQERAAQAEANAAELRRAAERERDRLRAEERARAEELARQWERRLAEAEAKADGARQSLLAQCDELRRQVEALQQERGRHQAEVERLRTAAAVTAEVIDGQPLPPRPTPSRFAPADVLRDVGSDDVPVPAKLEEAVNQVGDSGMMASMTAASSGQDAHAMRGAGRVFRWMSEKLRKKGEWQQAETACENAVRIFGELAQKLPEQPTIKAELVSTWGALGLAQANAGKMMEALDSLRSAAEGAEGLSLQFAEQGRYRRLLAHWKHELGLCLIKSGKGAEAEAPLTEAVKQQTDACAEPNATPADRAELERMTRTLQMVRRAPRS